MNGRWTRMAAVSAAALLGACATPHYGARIETFGASYNASGAINRRIKDVSDEEAERVKVYFGEMPAGFVRKEGSLLVARGYGHKVLGHVTTTGLEGYNEESRRSYCPTGKVLAWVLGIPTGMLLFFPFAGPCIYGHGSNSADDVEVRKAELVRALQRAAAAAGANAIVVDELGKTVLIDARTSMRLAQEEMTEMAGWAVVMGPMGGLTGTVAPAAPQEAAPASDD